MSDREKEMENIGFHWRHDKEVYYCKINLGFEPLYASISDDYISITGLWNRDRPRGMFEVYAVSPLGKLPLNAKFVDHVVRDDGVVINLFHTGFVGDMK